MKLFVHHTLFHLRVAPMVIMTPTPLSLRSWSRGYIPASILIVLLFFLFVFQLHPHARDNVPSLYGEQIDDAEYPAVPTRTGHQASHTPAQRAKRKAIVASVQRRDETAADWISELLPTFEAAVYVTDRTSDEAALSNDSPIRPLSLPVNKGREASTYLSYIISNWNDLPDYVIFIHGARYQYHNDDPVRSNG